MEGVGCILVVFTRNHDTTNIPLGVVGRVLVAFARIHQTNVAVRYTTNHKKKISHTIDLKTNFAPLQPITQPKL